MSKLLFTFFFLLIKVNNSYETNEDNIKTETIEPGISKTFFIQYLKETKLIFDSIEKQELQINIHSINCNIEINSNVAIQKQIDLNIYSLKINSNNNNIIIKPIIDIEEGRHKENYKLKECPIIINSYYSRDSMQQELRINNTEENAFYCPSIYKQPLDISYQIKNISINSFVSLNFKFKESQFLINIFYNNSNNQNNSLSKNITESTYIYLNSEFLKYDNNSNNTNVNGSLSINIQSTKNITIYMFLKIIEENTVCLLEENALNFGFITSKTTYQYYFTEVLKEKEGELMLHNKRQYGVLHAKLMDKKNIKNISDLYNTSNYPKRNSEGGLEFEQHYLRLKFNYSNTCYCLNGCYLLITYEHIKTEDEYPEVGYEFTILSRTWNYTDYISPLIDIPYNEYIIGCFGIGASREHFYSIYIPNEADNIIIQLEGDYFDAFYEKGRKKINTFKEKNERLGTKENQNVTIFNSIYIQELKKEGGFLSLSLRPKDYYTSIISSYYFRVLYNKEKETKYLPMDSNFANLCIPEKDSSSKFYCCNLKLKNDYNESTMNFSISSTNQNEYVKINLTGISNNTLVFNITDYFNLVYDQNKGYVDYFLIEFKFKNNEIKTIISSFCDKVNETYPQIYSAQMFYLNNFNKTHPFNLKNSFSGNYQFIRGSSGIPNDKFSFINFKGRLISLHIDNSMRIKMSTITDEFIYYLQLIHNIKIEDLKELKQGKPLIEFTDKKLFPLYYYYKIYNKEFINININIKISEHYEFVRKDYPIKGYILNEDLINRKMNGEFVDIPTPYIGNYSDAYGIGFLQINKKCNSNDTQYLLIELGENQKDEKNFFLYVEIMVKEYDNNIGFFLPQNKYFIDTFDDAKDGKRQVNQYSIFNPEGNKIQPIIEFSSDYNDITLNFSNNIIYSVDYSTGFQRFTIREDINETIFFNVINSNKTANFMIIYYLNDTNVSHSFHLDDNFTINDDDVHKNQSITNISLEFKGINIKNFDEDNIYFFITGTLYKRNEISKETINNTCFLYDRSEFKANKTVSIYNNTNKKSSNWTLVFKDFPRSENLIYDLRLQIIASTYNDNSQEEYLAFSIPVDLTGIKQNELTKNNGPNLQWYVWGIPVIVVGTILIIILLFFVIKIFVLKKKNTNLQEEMVSMAFSNDVQRNVLIKDMEISKNETDYESTFI